MINRSMILSLLIGFVAFTSCERRALTDLSDLNEYAELEFRTEWTEYDDLPPEDGTIIIYRYKDQVPDGTDSATEFYKTVIFGKSGIASIRLPKGQYAFIVANNKPDETATFFAKDYEAYESVIVRLADVEAPSYDHPEAHNIFVAQPEFLAIESMDKYNVTDEMVNETKRRVKSKSKAPVDILYFYPRQITRNVSVEIHVEGLNNLKSAEVVANGGYRGVYMSTQHTTDVVRCKLFRITEIVFYPGDLYNGVIRGYFTTFGGGGVKGKNSTVYSRQTESTILFTLFSTLKDKEATVVATPFDVTEQYNKEGQEKQHIEIKISDGVKLPDIEIEGGSGSGFNPDVGDWENGEEQEVPVGK